MPMPRRSGCCTPDICAAPSSVHWPFHIIPSFVVISLREYLRAVEPAHVCPRGARPVVARSRQLRDSRGGWDKLRGSTLGPEPGDDSDAGNLRHHRLRGNRDVLHVVLYGLLEGFACVLSLISHAILTLVASTFYTCEVSGFGLELGRYRCWFYNPMLHIYPGSPRSTARSLKSI